MSDYRFSMAPLASVTSINDDSIPSNTKDNFEFDYVDIGSVTTGKISEDPERMSWKESPSRAQRLANVGDTVVSTVRTYLRAISPIVCMSSQDGTPRVYSTGFAIVRPVSEKIDSTFLSYTMTSDAVIGQIDQASRGVSYPSINTSDLQRVRIPLPPLSEQERIADYLDVETAEIDRMVTHLDELIEEYDQRKFSVIRANTINGRGDSVHLSVICQMVTGGTPKKFDTDLHLSMEGQGIPWFKPENLGDSGEQPLLVTPEAAEQLRTVPTGSTLFCGIGATLGKVGYTVEPSTTNQQITALIPEQRVDALYLYYSMLSLQDFTNSTAPRSTMPILNNSRLGTTKIRLPSLDEQRRIADYLDEETARIDKLKSTATELRHELLSRRKALITEVVTGQKRIG